MSEIEVSFLDGEYYYYPDPCPFCGKGVLEFDECTNRYGGKFPVWVYCSNCEAQGPALAGRGNHNHYQSVVDAWNERTE